jgi:hypothetical protein
VPGLSIPVERLAEPRRHRMCGTTPVFVVKRQLHGNSLTHIRARRLANIAVQVKVEAAIANGHQIDAPWRFRLAIQADANGKRLAPTLSNMRRAPSADQHIGIDVIELNHCAKSQATDDNKRPGYLGRDFADQEARPPARNSLSKGKGG